MASGRRPRQLKIPVAASPHRAGQPIPVFDFNHVGRFMHFRDAPDGGPKEKVHARWAEGQGRTEMLNPASPSRLVCASWAVTNGVKSPVGEHGPDWLS